MAILPRHAVVLAIFSFLHALGSVHAQSVCAGISASTTIPWVVAEASSVGTQINSVYYSGSTAKTTAVTTTARWLTVNGKWPADPIVVTKCTQVTVVLTNSLGPSVQEDVTLHFHGILQKTGQNIMDGPEGITQSGIAPGQKFSYSFFTSEEGTYWIHSHHGGQYPKGVRAPLVVRNVNDPTDFQYVESNPLDLKDEIITLSDWFIDFWNAEEKSVSVDDTKVRICGKPNNNIGIEYPGDRVLMNDVGGFDLKRGDDRKSFTTTCGVTRRLRFINMSSHARFYVWFSDIRTFEIIELDGVSYKRGQSTNTLELASGQRASILVTAPPTNCQGAYIIAASDPKVGHGTRRCPQSYTNSARGIQYTHGYYDVTGATPLQRLTDLDVVNGPGISSKDRFRLWGYMGSDPIDDNFHFYPAGSFDGTANDKLQNRMKLDYKVIWYTNGGSFKDFTYGDSYTQPSGRDIGIPVGLQSGDDLSLSPKETVTAHMPPRPTAATSEFIHNIKLFRQGDPKKGLAAMMQVTSANDPGSDDTKFKPWMSPDKQDPYLTDYSYPPQLPSLFRALEWNGWDLDWLKDPARFQNNQNGLIDDGRTIMINDEAGGTTTPHWFVVRSDLGDHPMHLHGHHFQILARLPKGAWDTSRSSIADFWDAVSALAPKNPARRDTIWMERDVTYVLAIVPDNPGIWAMHCHNDMHAVQGMFSQVVERPKALRDLIGTWYSTLACPSHSNACIWSYTMKDSGTQPGLQNALWELLRQARAKFGWKDPPPDDDEFPPCEEGDPDCSPDSGDSALDGAASKARD